LASSAPGAPDLGETGGPLAKCTLRIVLVNMRSSERVDGGALAVVSDAVHGVRLARLLTGLVERGIALEVGAALCITRQILSAIDALHAYDRDVAHGALGPERVIINANARVIVAEYALGPALEQLRYSHQHYWKSLRIGLPRSAGVTKFDHRVDIMQIGSIAVALILGKDAIIKFLNEHVHD